MHENTLHQSFKANNKRGLNKLSSLVEFIVVELVIDNITVCSINKFFGDKFTKAPHFLYFIKICVLCAVLNSIDINLFHPIVRVTEQVLLIFV